MHHVFMAIRQCHGWRCCFSTKGRKPLPKRVTFSNADAVREMARRGRGLISNWARVDLDLAIELGRGGIWLILTHEQFQAVGGILTDSSACENSIA
jgi:hypothetical protein